MLLVDRLIIPAMRGKGKMPTKRIYKAVRMRAKDLHLRLPPQWRATVRNTLQRYCADSEKFVGEYHFRHVEKGVWECRDI
jgi:hypothetical protein